MTLTNEQWKSYMHIQCKLKMQLDSALLALVATKEGTKKVWGRLEEMEKALLEFEVLLENG